VSHCLLDTGPIVAYLAAGDPAHSRVAEWFEAYSGHLATTTAVITEAMHFVSADSRGPRRLAELIAATRTRIVGFDRVAELHAAAALMADYPELPMDYADATLLLLADRLSMDAIATLDRRGFAAYRTPRGRQLQFAFGAP
jgi:predicted nucleic acid-binding protein